MSFEDMPPQEPYVMPEARAYAAAIRERSRTAMRQLRTVLDLSYGPDYYQKIDIYLPDDSKAADLPVLIYLHGGGWEKGYKEEMGFMAPPIVSLPAIFVSVSYRLAPAVTNRAQVDDVVAAIALVHARIGEWGGSPDKLVIGGHSAGGHLAALTTLRRDKLSAAGLPANVIKYCLPVSAPYAIDLTIQGEGLERFFATEDEAREASPIEYVRGGAGRGLPFYISWAGQDFESVRRNGPSMIAALRDAGVPVDVDVFESMDHFDISLAHGDPGGRWVRKVRDILAAL